MAAFSCRFSLRAMLGAFWCVGTMLATARYGLSPLVALGVPVAIVGFALICSPKALVGKFKASFASRKHLALPICSWVLFIAIRCAATPLDTETNLVLWGGLAWPAALLLAGLQWLRLATLIPLGAQFLILTHLFAPRDVESLFPWMQGTTLNDLHRGSHGMQFMGLGFCWHGANMELINRHLGRIEPAWKHGCCLFPCRDGNERVDSRSLVHSNYLPGILERLPNDEARRQVLRCLTDRENVLRVHQGLLLLCLDTLGFPPGYDAESWWDKHEPVFRQERDTERAVRAVWRWRDRVLQSLNDYKPASNRSHEDWEELDWVFGQLSQAAYYQEHGEWGGDVALGRAFFELEIQVRTLGRREPTVDLDGISAPEVVWWPYLNRSP